jgi:hypothetical protein
LQAVKSLRRPARAARDQARKRAFKQGFNNGVPYERWGGHGRSLDLCKPDRMGSLRRVLNVLLARARVWLSGFLYRPE